jgi:enolase
VRITTNYSTFSSIVPSGASKGDYEAVELRDGDKSIYYSDSVLKAVHNVESVLGPLIIEAGLSPRKQLKEIDRLIVKIDRTKDKSKIGANAILGISMAAARAGAAESRMPLYRFLAREASIKQEKLVLPVPFINVLNGGDHSSNTIAF